MISNSVEKINAVTQQNVEGTRMIAQSVEALNHLTDNLQLLLGKFKLGNARPSGKDHLERSRKAVTEHGQLVDH
jgi:hypothetical protein